MITCPKCNTTHADYISRCPKCGYDKNAEQLVRQIKQSESIDNHNSINIFDLTFSKFTAPILIKLFFPLAIIASLLIHWMFLPWTYDYCDLTNSSKVLFTLFHILSFLIEVIIIRITCESLLVLFRIERNTQKP